MACAAVRNSLFACPRARETSGEDGTLPAVGHAAGGACVLLLSKAFGWARMARVPCGMVLYDILVAWCRDDLPKADKHHLSAKANMSNIIGQKVLRGQRVLYPNVCVWNARATWAFTTVAVAGARPV